MADFKGGRQPSFFRLLSPISKNFREGKIGDFPRDLPKRPGQAAAHPSLQDRKTWWQHIVHFRPPLSTYGPGDPDHTWTMRRIRARSPSRIANMGPYFSLKLCKVPYIFHYLLLHTALDDGV